MMVPLAHALAGGHAEVRVAMGDYPETFGTEVLMLETIVGLFMLCAVTGNLVEAQGLCSH